VAVEKGHGRDHAKRVVNRACPALGGTRPAMIKKALFFLYGGPRRFDFAQGPEPLDRARDPELVERACRRASSWPFFEMFFNSHCRSDPVSQKNIFIHIGYDDINAGGMIYYLGIHHRRNGKIGATGTYRPQTKDGLPPVLSTVAL